MRAPFFIGSTMTAPADSTAAVEQAALGPKRVTVDGQTVEQHSIQDLIAAADYAKAQDVASGDKPQRGIRYSRFKLPGANT